MDITRACRDLNELTPQAKKACEMFLAECKKRGLNVLITETYRPQARQDYLYEQGRSRSGQIVTWTHSSRHTSRRAWDICKGVKGQEYSDYLFFKKCGDVAKELGIIWGGIWKDTPDTPHFEINSDWKEPESNLDKIDIVLFGNKKTVDRILSNNKNYLKLQDLRCKEINVGYLNGIIINGKQFNPKDKILHKGNNYIHVREMEKLGYKVIYNKGVITISK